jgi:hypothetical protein
MSNLRQVNLALRLLPTEAEKFPQIIGSHWAWDVPYKVADAMIQNGTAQPICFCASCGFTPQDFIAQWNEFMSTPPAPNDYWVISYAMTFPSRWPCMASVQLKTERFHSV